MIYSTYFSAANRPQWARRPTITAGFSEAERQRFHNLLQLAAESPFEGERANALAAATRLATRCGLTLDEAAAGGSRQEPRHDAERSDDFMADDLGFRSHSLDRFARAALASTPARDVQPEPPCTCDFVWSPTCPKHGQGKPRASVPPSAAPPADSKAACVVCGSREWWHIRTEATPTGPAGCNLCWSVAPPAIAQDVKRIAELRLRLRDARVREDAVGAPRQPPLVRREAPAVHEDDSDRIEPLCARFGEGRARRGHRPVDIGLGAVGDASDDLAGGRAADLDPAAARRRAPARARTATRRGRS